MNQNLGIRWQAGDPPAALIEKEWIATNGLGGFASGTLLGVNSRRYHGLFVPNLTRPKGRHILLAHLTEEVECGATRAALSGFELQDGALGSQAHRFLTGFWLEGRMPIWRFRVGGALIEKRIIMPYRQNMVCVEYSLLEGDACALRLRPFALFRRQDAPLNHKRAQTCQLARVPPYYELRVDESELKVHFAVAPEVGTFIRDEARLSDVLYRVERERGYDHLETLVSPGLFRFQLTLAQPVSLMATVSDCEAPELDGPAALDAERKRDEKLAALAPAVARDPFALQLLQAADQFIVLPGSRLEESVRAESEGGELRTVIAGYHWFGDWGRDTMISLEGLTLVAGRWREAGAILRTFSHYVRDGLIPNLFPEGEREGLYHTVDATLWFFHAIDRYLTRTGDTALLRDLYPVLADIVAHHVRGTRFDIGVDPADGLLHAGARDLPLTWMDAKTEGWVVTPRRGKPVEIQALWYNALRLMADWSTAQEAPPSPYRELADRVQKSFNARYWDEACGHLYDVIDGEDGIDASCRPNQVFAVSLRHPVLDRSRWRQVIGTVERKLLTPFGLRTLSPEHRDYKRNYHGDLRTRDAAYHQGTVWPWLIGHFIDAKLRIDADRKSARELLRAFPGHLAEVGVGSISEVFDAEPPYLPRGCIAQAWSVAEVLRAWTATAPDGAS